MPSPTQPPRPLRALSEPESLARPERIGLLGGTFDPPHLGHVAAAVACRDALALDWVLMVVANEPWQKTPLRRISPAEVRIEMVSAALEGVPRVSVSRLEVDRGGPSYTIETVEEVLGEARGDGKVLPEVFVVIGADLVESLPTWERVDELARLVTLAVVTRPPGPGPAPPDGWRSTMVPMEGIDVSSSQVRDLVGRGRSIEGLVPPEVVHCIESRHLYAVPR